MFRKHGSTRARAGFALAALSALATTSLATTTASACPSCPVGRAARQQVLDHDFGTNLMIALVPFLLVGLVSRWAERIGQDGEARGAREAEP